MDYFAGTKTHVYQSLLGAWESACVRMLNEKEEDTKLYRQYHYNHEKYDFKKWKYAHI